MRSISKSVVSLLVGIALPENHKANCVRLIRLQLAMYRRVICLSTWRLAGNVFTWLGTYSLTAPSDHNVGFDLAGRWIVRQSNSYGIFKRPSGLRVGERHSGAARRTLSLQQRQYSLARARVRACDGNGLRKLCAVGFVRDAGHLQFRVAHGTRCPCIRPCWFTFASQRFNQDWAHGVRRRKMEWPPNRDPALDSRKHKKLRFSRAQLVQRLAMANWGHHYCWQIVALDWRFWQWWATLASGAST